MNKRASFLIGAAAGALVSGLTWLMVRERTEVGPVEVLQLGEPFPSVTGTTLAGERITVPDELAGRVSVLVLAFDYAARNEVEEWGRQVMSAYGEQSDIAVYLLPMISGVGPLMQRIIDTAMARATPDWERNNILTVYGDLRWLRKRLGIHGRPRAYVFLVDRAGRLLWRAEGSSTHAQLVELNDALGMQGITLRWKPE